MIGKRLAESKKHFSEMLERDSPTEFRRQITTALSGVYTVENKLIALFEADNPNFNRVKFLAASESKPNSFIFTKD